jgi:hypothetical protein
VIEKWIVRVVVAMCVGLYAMLWYNVLAGAEEQPPVGLNAPEPPAFVPFTVDEKNFNNIKAYLGEIPAKFATPMINTLDQAEFAAKEAWRFEHAPKPK